MKYSTIRYFSKKYKTYFYLDFSYSGVFDGSNLPRSIPMDLSTFIKWNLLESSNLNEIKNDFKRIQKDGSSIEDFNIKKVPHLKRILDDLIEDSSAHIIAKANKDLCHDLELQLNSPDSEINLDWIIQQIITRYQDCGRPNHYFFSWHYTAKFLDFNKLSPTKENKNRFYDRQIWARYVAGMHETGIEEHFVDLLKKAILRKGMPLIFVPHKFRLHPKLLSFFLAEHALNLLPKANNLLWHKMFKNPIRPVPLDGSAAYWRAHINSLFAGEYLFSNDMRVLLHDFGKTPQDLLLKEILFLRNKFNLKGKYLISIFNKNTSKARIIYTSIKWLNRQKTFFSVRLFGSEFMDVYHIQLGCMFQGIKEVSMLKNKLHITLKFNKTVVMLWDKKYQKCTLHEYRST